MKSGHVPILDNGTLDAALSYAARGWRVLPVHCPPDDAKKARIRDWGTAATTDADTIRGWWKQWPDANIGVLTGAVSGVFVLDVDPRSGGNETLANLEAEHGALPDTVESQTGGGGRHIFFRVPSGMGIGTTKLGPGLDLRGDRVYVVVPPSVHGSGVVYEWESSSHPDTTEIADAPKWLLPHFTQLTQVYTGDTGLHKVTHNTQGVGGVPAYTEYTVSSASPEKSGTCVDWVHDSRVIEAIHRTLPKHPGERNDAIFQFVRDLKAIDGLRDVKATSLLPVIREWHRRALPVILTKDPIHSVARFMGAWKSAKYAAGERLLSDVILPRAMAATEPACAERYGSDAISLLIRICRELQAEAGGNPFYLGCRSAGSMIGVSHTTANDLLDLLVVDDVLMLVEKGKAEGRKASTFRYRAAA
jgi:hypothetical protein